MAKHHLIISGTGRTGTTFLVQLLTALGLDTGFSDPGATIDANANAGMERDIRDDDAPYVIKSPWLCDFLDDIVESEAVVIDHALVPIRDLYSAAQSRRDVTEKAGTQGIATGIPGGLWKVYYPQQQEAALAQQLYKLMHTLAKRDIPTTLLHFPRFVRDPEYLYGKLRPVLGGVGYESFLQEFKRVAQPDLVHEYSTLDKRARKD